MIPLGVLASGYVAPAGGGALLDPTYITQAVDSAGKSTYTWSNVNIGTASSTRTVLVVFSARISTTVTTATTITAAIGGTSATVDYYKHVIPSESGGAATGAVGFVRLPVSTGTTATISVTVSSNCLRTGISVYTIDGPVSLHDSDWGYEPGALGISHTLETSSGGVVFAGGHHAALSGASLSNPTADHTTLIGSNYYHQTGSGATDGTDETVTWATTVASYTVAAAVAYAPA